MTRATSRALCRSTVVFCAALLNSSGLSAQAGTVERIADRIEAHYFAAAHAAEIARSLRAALAAGEFAGLDRPAELASALSERLARIDAHLNVAWRDPDSAGVSVRSAEPMSETVRAARWNDGFRKVEVLSGNIGLIEMTEFAGLAANDGAPSPARAAADAMLALMARADALVFDLRDNGGGGGMVEYLLSHFLPAGLVFNEMRGRTGTREGRSLEVIGGTRRLDVPLYVVVSGRTGSAAEFFAYTLQSLGRATVVGERTAGAANPGMVFDAGDGFTVFVPTGTPVNRVTGTNWERVGVRPDVAVPAEHALRRAHILALEQSLTTAHSEPAARDTRWALEALLARRPADDGELLDLTGAYGNRVVRIEAGRLVVRRDRWPARVLHHLGSDVFVVEGVPWRRVRFERGPDGRATALIELTSMGDETTWRATGPLP